MAGVTVWPDRAGPARWYRRRVSRPSSTRPGWEERQPVVEDRRVGTGGRSDHEWRTGETGLVGVAAQPKGEGRQHLAQLGPAPGCGEHGAPLLGLLAAGRPHESDHQVGHGVRGNDDLVAPGRELESAGPPGQPAHQPIFELRSMVTSEKSAVPAPTQAELDPPSLRPTSCSAPVGWT